MSTHQPRILIVGAGIAGLTLANFLSREKYPIEIVEKTARLRPVGAGIVLHPNSMRVLELLKLGNSIASRGAVLDEFRVCGAGGRTLSTVNQRDARAQGRRTVGIHRAALHEILVGGLDGIRLRLDTTVESLQHESHGVRVVFSDGTTGEYDLVVGADGLHSRVRDLAWGAVSIRDSEYVCWRFVVRPQSAFPAGTAVEALGSGMRTGLVPVGNGQVYGFVVANRGAGDERNATRDGEALKALFMPHFGGLAGAILGELTANDTLIYNDLGDLWVDEWVHRRVVLLGDAAHAMTPNLGQGAAMAIEDAKALHFTLDTIPDLDEALARFFALRKDRVRAVHDASWRMGRVNQQSHPVVASLRNLMLRIIPSSAVKRQSTALIDGGNEVQEMLSHRPEMPTLAEESIALVRLLGKIALSDGVLGEDERQFIVESLGAAGSHTRRTEIDHLITNAARTDLEDLVAPFATHDPDVKSEILYSAVRLATVNRAVEPGESMALENTRRLFGVSREVYNAMYTRARDPRG